MANKFDFEKVKQAAENIIRKQLLWKPAKFTIAVDYKIEELRHYLYVRADEWTYIAIIDDEVIDFSDMCGFYEFYEHLRCAARALNDEFRRKHDIPGVPSPEERREPDSIYPPW